MAFKDRFKNDPWEDVAAAGAYYPKGQRLDRLDNRFWIATEASTKCRIIFIEPVGEAKELVEKHEKTFDSLSLSHEQSNGISRLVIRLNPSEELHKKFTEVVKYLSAHSAQKEGEDLLKYIIQTLKEWSNFLKPTRNGLPYEEYIGLWGELVIMNDYFCAMFPSIEAVNLWKGPENAPQDMTLGEVSIEIKTTFSGKSKKLHISSLDQLDSDTPISVLVHVSANQNPTGRSLRQLHDGIQIQFRDDEEALILFNHKCSELFGKASNTQLDQLNECNEINTYEIRSDFPRLIRGNIPEEILDANYTIRLSSLKPWLLNDGLEGALKLV